MLVFDLRCNRCGYVFPMPLTHTSCPHCDMMEEARERRLFRLKHAALTVIDLWRLGSTDAELWAQAKDILRDAAKDA